MKINIYSTLNGVGLERDYILMRGILESAGHQVAVSNWNAREGAKQADVAFHLEVPRTRHCAPNLLAYAPINILLPNAEWFSRKWLDEINKFDQIWCKTRDCLNIFSGWHSGCKYTGFISEDIYLPDIKKQPLFIHIAGNSMTKGTAVLCDAYYKCPDLPKCFIIGVNSWPCYNNLSQHSRLSWDDLQILINSARFNICTSEYEGWGHYLHEALGCKSVVMSTNGAPMNEFVTDPRCLVEQTGTAPMNMADKKIISVNGLIEKIVSLQKLSDADLNEIGEINRVDFLKRNDNFRNYLLTYISNL